MHQDYPIFKNDLYYDTFQRSFLVIIKAQGLHDVAGLDYDPGNGDYYEQDLFLEKQPFVYSVFVTSLQTDKGRKLVKECEGDARSILSKQHHYHTQSNVAQHEVVMTTFTGHTKSSATSESQTALSNFKRGTKKDASGLSHLQE